MPLEFSAQPFRLLVIAWAQDLGPTVLEDHWEEPP